LFVADVTPVEVGTFEVGTLEVSSLEGAVLLDKTESSFTGLT
jgi:hypothetical protein